MLLEKIINEAKFLHQINGFGGINTQDAEIYQVVKFLNRDKRNLIIDVGANIGSYSEKLIKILNNIEIVLFEPNTENYNILINKFIEVENVSIQKYGLSDKKGVTKLFSDLYGSGLASISKRNLIILVLNLIMKRK